VITFGTREGVKHTVVGVMVFGMAVVLAMEVLHEAMIVVDDWMQWVMSKGQRRRWSEVRLRRGRAVVKAGGMSST
jgi:hypothetical protein